ncbi:MAG TPA: AbrB/MazE/SpoVT family DNA-binding domain-containing protein [Bryobacteraceae bacterium]|jgi:AbrB family looped-hinge helix DNA binding protein|nr:AbrB/MazE/SpoVT family DNA-binding domain-containing protein [Bryobacteraceae bacterium]
MRTTIDRAGRVVIPKALRERAGIAPGTQVELREIDGVIQLIAPRPQGRIVNEDGVWVWESAPGTPPITQEQIDEAIEELREGRLRDEDRSGF